MATSKKPAKKNLLGLGMNAKRRRAAKRRGKADVLDAKSTLVRAKAGLLRAKAKRSEPDVVQWDCPNCGFENYEEFTKGKRPAKYTCGSCEQRFKARSLKLRVNKSKANPQQKFSQDTLRRLRKQFAGIDGANIVKYRAKFDKLFAGTSRTVLKQLADAKIEWVSKQAANALVARRNPAKGTKKNLHPLEVGANAAMILGGLDHLWSMMKRGQKKPRKRKNSTSRRKSAAAKRNCPGKKNGPIKLTAADIAKLPPSVREKLGIAEDKSKATKSTKDVVKLWRVSWYSAQLRRRVAAQSFFPATSKSGAIAEAKSALGVDYLKRNKLPLPVNFIAKQAKRNPKAMKNLGLISLVENIQAAEYLRSKLAKKKKNAKRVTSRPAKNPEPAHAQIRKDFLGRESTGRSFKLFTLPGGPKRAGALAQLASIELMGGKVQNFPKGAAYIGGIKRGQLRRMVIGLKQPFPIPNGMPEGKAIVIGEVKRFDYWARKPHLYGENSPVYRFTHAAGEEGGRRPVLVFHNGAIGFRGGDYKIEREGVRD